MWLLRRKHTQAVGKVERVKRRIYKEVSMAQQAGVDFSKKFPELTTQERQALERVGRRTARPAPPRPGGHDPPPRPGGHDPPSRPPRPQMGPSGPPPRPQMGPPPRPRPGPPGPGPRFPASGFLGPEGLLGRLLPRGLDAEELLILAVLLLAMKQDGAGSTELLIAAALYLLL